MHGIVTHRFRSANRFLEAISLRNKRFNHSYSEFIFRGQSDAEWRLMPAALRGTTRLPGRSGWTRLRMRTIREQVEGEWHLISSFIEGLNQNGLHLPNEDALAVSATLTRTIDFVTRIGRGEMLWPPPELHSIIALAQHNGIPTRFLDWTYNPFVAAYFAARDYFSRSRRTRDQGNIAVFALDANASDFRAFNFVGFDRYREAREHTRRFQLVKSPSYFNSNLKAQRGVFLAYVETHFMPNDPCQPLYLDEFIGTQVRSSFAGGAMLQKFVLPRSECPELLRLLALEFVDAGSLFPGPEGTAQAVKEKLTWSIHMDYEGGS